MANRNRDTPAYPEPVTDNGYQANGNLGLTKRELVASNILVALIRKHGLDHDNDCAVTIEHDWLYEASIKAADKFFNEIEISI